MASCHNRNTLISDIFISFIPKILVYIVSGALIWHARCLYDMGDGHSKFCHKGNIRYGTILHLLPATLLCCSSGVVNASYVSSQGCEKTHWIMQTPAALAAETLLTIYGEHCGEVRGSVEEQSLTCVYKPDTSYHSHLFESWIFSLLKHFVIASAVTFSTFYTSKVHATLMVLWWHICFYFIREPIALYRWYAPVS